MQLSQISIYPIKSLAPLTKSQSIVTPRGLEQDRLLMLVDEQGLFITQRKYPKLALIQVVDESPAAENSLDLSLSAPDMAPLRISQGSFSLQKIPVEVWGDSCQALVADGLINQWFSQLIGFNVRLVSYDPSHPRPIAPDFSLPGDSVSFADGFPLLVISQASLDDLNSRLSTPVSMLNFRPNIVVSGSKAYAEDDWKKISIGDVTFDAVKPCSRCVLTTVNPTTGVKDPQGEPLKTLSQYRRAPGGVMFGMNLIPRDSGEIKTGDAVTVIA